MRKSGLSAPSKGALVFTLLLLMAGLATLFAGPPAGPVTGAGARPSIYWLADGTALQPQAPGEGLALRVLAGADGRPQLAPWPLFSDGGTDLLLQDFLAGLPKAAFVILILDVSPDLTEAARTVFLRALQEALSQSAIEPSHLLLASLSWPLLDQAAKFAANYPLGYMTSEQPDFDSVGRRSFSPWLGPVDWAGVEGSLPQLVRQRGGDAWLPHFRDLREVDLDEAKALGLEVLVWPAEQKDVARGLEEMGVDGILLGQSAR